MSKKDSLRTSHEIPYVEKPFMAQLEGLNWETRYLQLQQSANETGRKDCVDVVLPEQLKQALKTINPWLEPDQIDELVAEITQFDSSDLLVNNQKVLKLLQDGTSVGENRQTGALNPTVQFMDFSDKGLENNNFLAVSQFKVRIPASDKHIYPDIILFVNGLPLVVIECKSPRIKGKEPIPEAIAQMMRYSEQRDNDTGVREGNQKLFFYNQILVATCRNMAKFGTITTQIEKHFYSWSDPYPATLNDLESEGSSPNAQQRLVCGMFTRANLLSLIRTFTLFTSTDTGHTIKIVGRYQQFRAVKLTVNRLLEGKSPQQRSGIIWHTQGSGKSLTMMFMVREMYQHPELCEWKIVFVTDRTQLEEQLHETSQGVKFKVNKADSIDKLKELLKNPSSDLNMAMIHKFRDKELDTVFDELNPSDKILVMTDEAHRSQYSKLGANLDKALPHATHIGYTGTPTDKTEKKYKDYIDRYTMRQAVEDGVTLKIVYEGRTDKAEVADKKAMDKQFADVFSDYNLLERLQILGYKSRDAYLEATPVIEEKAKDMVRHYIDQVYPNGFKAQVVANSREAAHRYKGAIEKALTNAILDLENSNPLSIELEKLRKVKAAVVISGSQNDEPHIKAHTNPDDHKKVRRSFKLPYGQEDEGINGDIGFVIVQNMWLTGFDAPIEQVLYIDRNISAHNLLQAIARTNRVYNADKDTGFVVDYVGIGHHLADALKDFDEKELKELTEDIDTDNDDLNKLVQAHKEIKAFITEQGIDSLDDLDAFYDLFYDEELCFKYSTLFRAFASAFAKVLPHKEALDYDADFRAFTEINAMAMRHFSDDRVSLDGVPKKLRAITDEHLQSKGISSKVEPISIFEQAFEDEMGKRKRKSTKAAGIEHALRHHIDINMDDDPALYASFAEELERIFEECKDNWEAIHKKLEELRKRMQTAKNEPTYGLHRKKQMPFFRILKKELFADKKLSDDDISRLVSLTQHFYNHIERELKNVGFLDSTPAQNKLKKFLMAVIQSPEFFKWKELRSKKDEIVSRLMEHAISRYDTIVYG